MDHKLLRRIKGLLKRLGLTPNYTGHYQTAYAVYMAIQDPQVLCLITKCLYPEVAKYCGVTDSAVERNIRTGAGIIWKYHAAELQALTETPLTECPKNAQFLSILTEHFLDEQEDELADEASTA